MLRRRFLVGLSALLCAPAIVRFESIMPVRAIVMPFSGPVLEVIGIDGEIEKLTAVDETTVKKILNAQLVFVR